MYDLTETETEDVDFALSVIGPGPKNILDESVPRLIQFNGTGYGNLPRNKAFPSKAAHGSLFLLPGNQDGNSRRLE